MTKARNRCLAGLVTLFTAAALFAHVGVQAGTVQVHVLDEPDLAPVAAPEGTTPDAVASMLADQGLDVVRVPGDAVPADALVIVNPYGEAYPDTPAVQQALKAGAGWVNLAGTPFARPNGTADPLAPERHGVRSGGVPSLVVTGTSITELGMALMPAWASSDHNSGRSLHALDPVHERPLVEWIDAEFPVPNLEDDNTVRAGPAVVLITAPYRIVAAGFAAESSPLSPSDPDAAELLADLVRVAWPTGAQITGMSVQRTGDVLTVDATASGGQLQGVGTYPAPPRWTPERPIQAYATVRLWEDDRLVDLLSLPSNPAEVITDGEHLRLNGEPYLVTGMASGASTPRGLEAHERARILREDLKRMREVGVTAYRLYGGGDDWTWNATARSGLLLVPAVSLGWIFDGSVAAAEARLPQARDLGRSARGRHNVLMLGVGNEFMDVDHDRMKEAVELLADEMRSANDEGALITYGASHNEPWLMGPMPFLDVYSVNCYGMSYPYGYVDPGFVHCIVHAKEFGAVDQPLVLGEWGANTWQVDDANMTLRERAGVFVPELEIARAEFVRQKWFTMMELGAAGGFAFQWADGLDKCLFSSMHCTVTDPVVLPGSEDTGYRPMNHEKYWGFHDVWRNPRLALFALKDIYVNANHAPTGLLSN